MNILSKALASVALLSMTAAPVLAQEGHRGDRGGHERGDRGGRGDHDRGGRGDWDRGNRGGHDRGDWDRRGGHRGGHGDDFLGGVFGGLIGGFLLGENQNYRFRYDDNYYGSRGYDRGYYDNWRSRDRGIGCRIVGYGRGCRTIHYSQNFMILNLGGEVYCYRRTYRGWSPTYCPRDWYNY